MSKRKRHSGSRDRSGSALDIEGIGRFVPELRAEAERAKRAKTSRSPSPDNPIRSSANGNATFGSTATKPANSTSADEDGWTKVERHESSKRKDAPEIYSSEHQNRIKAEPKLSDLQKLILYILSDGKYPAWVNVISRKEIGQVVVLMVPGLELGMFSGDIDMGSELGPAADRCKGVKKLQSKYRKLDRLDTDNHDYFTPAPFSSGGVPKELRPLADIFTKIYPMRVGNDYSTKSDHRIETKLHSPVQTILTSLLPQSSQEAEAKQKMKRSGRKGPALKDASDWVDVPTPVTSFLATCAELLENDYAVHPTHGTAKQKHAAQERRMKNHQTSEYGWVDTNVDAAASTNGGAVEHKGEGSLSAGKHVLSLDCEMCEVQADAKGAKKEQALTYITVTDWDGKVVYETFVKPEHPIVNYVAHITGYSEETFKNVTTSLVDVQQRLLSIINQDTILVGHSLESDLKALRLTHPFIVDTALLYPHYCGPPYKNGLKTLVARYLGGDFRSTGVHDSTEDAKVTLELVKQKCQRGTLWGTKLGNFEPIFKRIGRSESILNTGEKQMSAMVDWGQSGYAAQASVSIRCQSDDDVAAGIKDAVLGDAPHQYGTSGPVDFVWGRLRELELARGWTTEDEIEKETIYTNAVGGSECTKKAPEATGHQLGKAVARTTQVIKEVYDSLPPLTAFMVYSGTGDTRMVMELIELRSQDDYDFTRRDEDDLSDAICYAREGITFVTVKPED